jgi:hypothetical protein
MVNGVRMKHGKGKVIHGNTTAGVHGNEVYEGDWENNLMQGEGTYYFTSGAVYKGQWINGKRHGNGIIEYPDGSLYEGQWEQDLMHGNGKYIDNGGLVWEGIFIKNKYQSTIQKKLKMERKIELKIAAFEKSSEKYFQKFFEAYVSSDKKTMKDNLTPFFARPEELPTYVLEPFTKYEEKSADQWNDIFHKLIDDGGCYKKALANAEDSIILSHERIKAQQLAENPGGQIVEFSKLVDTKTI